MDFYIRDSFCTQYSREYLNVSSFSQWILWNWSNWPSPFRWEMLPFVPNRSQSFLFAPIWGRLGTFGDKNGSGRCGLLHTCGLYWRFWEASDWNKCIIIGLCSLETQWKYTQARTNEVIQRIFGLPSKFSALKLVSKTTSNTMRMSQITRIHRKSSAPPTNTFGIPLSPRMMKLSHLQCKLFHGDDWGHLGTGVS